MTNKKYVFEPKYWYGSKCKAGRQGCTVGTLITAEDKSNFDVDELTGCEVMITDESKSKLLLIKQNGGGRKWEVPGGHREGEETAEQCAIRESVEEAGVNIKNLKLLSTTVMKKLCKCEHNDRYPDSSHTQTYGAQIDSKEVDNFTPNREVSEIRLVPFKDVYKYWPGFDHESSFHIDRLQED